MLNKIEFPTYVGTLPFPFILIIWIDEVIKSPETNYSNIIEFMPLGSPLFVLLDKDIFFGISEKETLKLTHFCKNKQRSRHF